MPVDLGRREHDLTENMLPLIRRPFCQVRLQRFEQRAIAHTVGKYVNTPRPGLSHDGVEEVGHFSAADAHRGFIDGVSGGAALRWPAVQKRRAVEIEVVDQLSGTPRGIFERVVESMDEDEQVLRGCGLYLLLQGAKKIVLRQRRDLIEEHVAVSG